jgi:hypothetical protein
MSVYFGDKLISGLSKITAGENITIKDNVVSASVIPDYSRKIEGIFSEINNKEQTYIAPANGHIIISDLSAVNPNTLHFVVGGIAIAKGFARSDGMWISFDVAVSKGESVTVFRETSTYSNTIRSFFVPLKEV